MTLPYTLAEMFSCNIQLLSNLWYKPHFSRQYNCWSHRCIWSIVCRRCSNCIFILDLTPGFNGLGKDNCRTRWETFRFWDSVCLYIKGLTVYICKSLLIIGFYIFVEPLLRIILQRLRLNFFQDLTKHFEWDFKIIRPVLRSLTTKNR